MKTTHIILLTLFAAGIAAAAPVMADRAESVEQAENERSATADPGPLGGMLRTLPHGAYQCALPGDAEADAFVEVAEENFRISTASSYTNDLGEGTYLLRGNELVFTRGPKKGERYRRIGTNQVRKLDRNNEVGKLICTRIAGTS